jgi:hypothetical protein
MARKIEVIELSGDRGPDIKKHVARRLVKRLLAIWVVENVRLRRLAICKITPAAAAALASNGPDPVYCILPPRRPEILLLYYPLPDQSSFGLDAAVWSQSLAIVAQRMVHSGVSSL